MEQFYKVHQTTPWVTVHQVRPERLLGQLDFSKPERVDAISLMVTCSLTASRLAVTKPRLRISVSDTSYESSLVIGGLLRLICTVVSLIGVVLLIRSFLVQRPTIRS